MDPALAQHFNRYNEFLDYAEDNISAWFKASMLTDPDAPVDHRGLNSIVLTLRRVVELRRTLRDWSEREEQAARPKASYMSEEEIDRYVKDFLREHPDAADDPPPHDPQRQEDPHNDNAPPADPALHDYEDAHDNGVPSPDNASPEGLPESFVPYGRGPESGATMTAPFCRRPPAIAGGRLTDKTFEMPSRLDTPSKAPLNPEPKEVADVGRCDVERAEGARFGVRRLDAALPPAA